MSGYQQEVSVVVEAQTMMCLQVESLWSSLTGMCFTYLSETLYLNSPKPRPRWPHASFPSSTLALCETGVLSACDSSSQAVSSWACRDLEAPAFLLPHLQISVGSIFQISWKNNPLLCWLTEKEHCSWYLMKVFSPAMASVQAASGERSTLWERRVTWRRGLLSCSKSAGAGCPQWLRRNVLFLVFGLLHSLTEK